MLGINGDENTEIGASKEDMETTEENVIAAEENITAPAEEENEKAATEEAEQQETPPQPQNESNNEGTLNPLNEIENNPDADTKTKHRRYWTPKEEERFYEIWGRENWRLTRHGKNTIFFAKWADEMRDRFNIDIKTEEIQCKVNQTRAKFRQVKKHMETDKTTTKWKKFEIVERILKNEYRSKDDEPVPLEALENNRDAALIESHNCITQPSSPTSASNMSNLQDQNINLTQSYNNDHQLTEEVNMSSATLSDQNLFCNISQAGNSFSTELFGSDQLEIKQEIENDLKHEGFTELSLISEHVTDDITAIKDISANHISTTDQLPVENLLLLQQPAVPPKLPLVTENVTNFEPIQIHSSNPNSLLIQNRMLQNHNNNNNITTDVIVNMNNHANTISNSMQPPRALTVAPSPRKRNRSSSVNTAVTPIVGDSLETLYLEEVRKKNVLLVEQGEINRKRLRLEERKVKMMEEFFPKFMNLQQEILQKLQNVTNTQTQITN